MQEEATVIDETTEEITEEETSEETTEETTEETEEETTSEEKGETEEKEPTIKDVLERLERSEERLEKSEKRVGYLTRKANRPGATPETKPLGDKPVEDSFETNAEFVEAQIDYKVDQREAARAEARAKQDAQNKEDDFFAVIEAGPDKYADFNEVARKQPKDGGPVISEPMFEAMSDAENPVDIAYWLGQNVEESRRIASMTPREAQREINRLEMKLTTTGVPQKVKTKSTTPTKVTTGKTVPEDNLDNMGTDDFMSSRNKVDGVE